MTEIQLPDWAECFFQPARYIVLHGGRGSAKSRSAASALVLKAASGRERILCAREVQLSIKDSSKRLIDDEIKRQGLETIFESTQTEIRCKPTGSLFLFHGLRHNIESIKSMEGLTIVWVEEANTISQASLDLLIPTVRAPGSQIWFTFNPTLTTDPVYKMFVADTPPPNSIVLEVNYVDNPWFPEVLRQEMEWDRSRDPDKYNHVWCGKCVQHSQAQVFYKKWRIEPVPEPGPKTRLYFGGDWGFAGDPTTLVRCWMKDRSLYVDYAIGGVGVEIDQIPALFDTVPGSRKFKIIADSARPETISYVKKRGFNVVAAKKGAGSIEDGVAFLQSFDIVVDPRCKGIISELSLYSYKVDRVTGDILPFIEDKHNHYIDALRYATEGTRRGTNYKGLTKW